MIHGSLILVLAALAILAGPTFAQEQGALAANEIAPGSLCTRAQPRR